MTIGNATAVLLYQRTIVMAIMGMNTQLVSLGKVWGSSYKCAQMIVGKKLVKWEGDSTIDSNQEGNLDVSGVTFAYPSKKNVTVLKGTTINV